MKRCKITYTIKRIHDNGRRITQGNYYFTSANGKREYMHTD